MPSHAGTLLAHLQHLAAQASSDATLLSRWISQRDEAAFTAIVARHGPMVLSVCRRISGDAQHAEDVFQATFLVLARKAARLRCPEALASFLYSIALRLARKARVAGTRRPVMPLNPETPEPVDPSPHPLDVLSGRELLALLDAEIARLPDVYRLPLLLCVLQGRTLEEAARQLGWSVGSLRGRLEHGRARLQQRLTRRGLDLSVGVAALLAPVVVPESLLAASVRQVSSPARLSIPALTGDWTMALPGKTIGLGLLLLTMAGLGASLPLLRSPQPQRETVAAPTVPPAQARSEPRRDRYGDPLPPGAIARLGTLRYRIDTHRVEQMAFAPDGKTLAAASHRGLTLFDVATGKQKKTIKPPNIGFTRLAYSPDGKRLLTYGRVPGRTYPGKMLVQVWDVADERKISETQLPYVCWLGWSAEGQPRAACLDTDEIIYHEIDTGRKRRFPAKGLLDPKLVNYCQCVAVKNLLAASGANGAVHVWDLTNGKERFMLQPGVFVSSLTLSADGRWLASVVRDAANKYPVQLWDMATGKLMRTLLLQVGQVLFAPDGKTLFASGRETCFWEVTSGRKICHLRGEGSTVREAFAFSPDSKTFVNAEPDCGVIHL